MINERGHRAKAAISHTDKSCLHSCLRAHTLKKKKKIKQNPTRQALSLDRNKNWGRVAGKVETCQVNKLLNFDRQLMMTLFNLEALLGESSLTFWHARLNGEVRQVPNAREVQKRHANSFMMIMKYRRGRKEEKEHDREPLTFKELGFLTKSGQNLISFGKKYFPPPVFHWHQRTTLKSTWKAKHLCLLYYV